MTRKEIVEFEITNIDDAKLLMVITRAIIKTKIPHCTHETKCKILDDAMQALELIYIKNNMKVELTTGFDPFPITTFQNKNITLNEKELVDNQALKTQINELLEQDKMNESRLLNSLLN